VLDFLGHSVDRSSTKQYAPNLLSKKALKLIAAGRTFPPVGPYWVGYAQKGLPPGGTGGIKQRILQQNVAAFSGVQPGVPSG